MNDCTAMTNITVGSPGPLSKAALVCDLKQGHESLHYDAQDCVWWRHAPDEDVEP